MPTKDQFSDDYVAELLLKDAKHSTAKYSSYGPQDKLPRRSTTNAPKPNTRFLKNIIKETDSHNAALRARELEESRARLRRLRDDSGADRSADRDHRSKRRRVDGDRNRDAPPGRSSRVHSMIHSETPSERNVDGDSRRRRHHHRQGDDHGKIEDEGGKTSRRRHRRHRRRGHHSRSGSKQPSEHNTRHRRRSRSRSRSPRAFERHRPQQHRPRQQSRSTSPISRKPHYHGHTKARKPPPSPQSSTDPTGSESDPLASVLGPAPLPAPQLQMRGRGTFASHSAMDNHFASSYDPSLDVQPNPEEDNDWDQALEALRDRQRWQKQGAERLKQAGFSEDAVKKWERGGEQREADVKWKRQGERREWDRGKVVGEERVTTAPEWGRLKGT